MRKFKKTVDADGFVPDLSDTTKQQIAVYSLKFTTAPNDGVYEMTIELKNGKLQFDERTISRTNMYGDQPKCVAEKRPHLRKYCYCKWGEASVWCTSKQIMAPEMISFGYEKEKEEEEPEEEDNCCGTQYAPYKALYCSMLRCIQRPSFLSIFIFLEEN